MITGIAILTNLPSNEQLKSKRLEEFEGYWQVKLATIHPHGLNSINELKEWKELIHSRRQPAKLKNILTNAEFSTKLPEVSKCGKSKCECCKYLFLSNHYIFNYKFTVKSSMSCESSDLIYVVVFPNCQGEYIGETGINRQKLQDRVRIYRQHIRQPKCQMLKVEEHVGTCGNGQFKIFPFLKMLSKDTELRRAFEERFQLRFKMETHLTQSDWGSNPGNGRQLTLRGTD